MTRCVLLILSMLWATFPNTARAQTPTLGLLAPCNYCIEAKRLGVPQKNGTKRVIAASMMRMNVPLDFMVGFPPYVRASGQTVQEPLIADSEALPQVMLTNVVVPWRVGTAVVQSITGIRYSELIKTDSVCVGSQFRIPNFLYLGVDALPMATPRLTASHTSIHLAGPPPQTF